MRWYQHAGVQSYGIVVRYVSSWWFGRQPQVLLFEREYTDALQVLGSGYSSCTPFDVRDVVQLTKADTGKAFHWCDGTTPYPVYDAATDAVYFVRNGALMRLDANNTVSTVAGGENGISCQGGPASVASFGCITSLAADGRGSLYIADDGGIVFCRLAPSGSREGEGSQAFAIHACNGPDRYRFEHLAWRASDDSSGGHELIAATRTAVYRVLISESPGGGPPRLGDPVLLAGSGGSNRASCDGIGSAARFKSVAGILLSPDGCSAIIVDPIRGRWHRLRKLDLATGAVTTISDVSPWNVRVQMAWLPGDYLAVCSEGGEYCIFHIPELTQSAATAGPSRHSRSLADQMERSVPTSINFRLGPKVYDIPRAVLVERSAYFKRRLAGGETEVELADTDPAAVAALVWYMATGDLKDLPPAQLRVTAELAARWWLDGALAELEQRLLAASTSETLVSDFLWAERHSFQSLAAALKERLLSQVTAVMAATPEVILAQLAERNPALAAKMMEEAGRRMQR